MAKDPQKAFNQDGVLNADAVAALSNALAAADKSTFSYLEFRLAVQKLMALGQDQQQAFESVLTTAATIGVDRKAVIKSAQAYLKTLDTEHQKFQQAMQKRLTEGVAADEAKIEKIAQSLAKLQEQKAQIEARIAETELKKASLETELQNVRARVEERGAHMQTAYDAIRAEISDDFDALKKIS